VTRSSSASVHNLPLQEESHAGAVGPYAGRTFIIVNPAAGQDQAKRLRRRLGGAFAERGAAFDIEVTQYAGHASVLAREAAGLGYRAVCVVGGDGTLAEAASGVAGTNTPIAIIPRGTANQVAQNLHIPRAFDQAVDVAVNGRIIPVDLGWVNGRAFALVAGAGFDAAVMQRATRTMKERWGFAAYIYAAVKESLSATPARFRITADGQSLDIDAVTVMIANVGELFSAYIPLSLSLAPSPTNSWQDGLFEVVIIAPRNPPELARILWRTANRKFSGDERLIHLQAREVTIESEQPVPVQIDGDPCGHTPVTATVDPGGLRVLLPRAP
jgi:diacylglycerol kinase (ATP)